MLISGMRVSNQGYTSEITPTSHAVGSIVSICHAFTSFFVIRMPRKCSRNIADHLWLHAESSIRISAQPSSNNVTLRFPMMSTHFKAILFLNAHSTRLLWSTFWTQELQQHTSASG
jgi:hypothetical protein